MAEVEVPSLDDAKQVLNLLFEFYYRNGYGDFLLAIDRDDTDASRDIWHKSQLIGELLMVADRQLLARLVMYQANKRIEEGKLK